MTNWYYHDPAQGRVGPIDADALRGHFRAGDIGRDTLLWRQGLAEWQPLERLAGELGLDQELQSATPPPVPPPLPSQASVGSTRTDSNGSGPDAASDAPAADTVAHSQRSVSPADYAPAHVNRRAAAPPPKRGLSGCMIALLVLAALAIPVIGIVAAIALPAYQDYTFRAKVSSALAASAPYKLQVAEHYSAHAGCPNNQSPGFRPADAYAGAQIAAVEFGRFEDSGQCGVQIRLRGFNNPKLDDKKLWLSFDPTSQQWSCTSDIEKQSVLPADCRR